VTARGVAMHGQRRLAAKLKRERVTAAIDACVTSGIEVTITGVARRAGVSRKFIYSHPDLRAELELRALRATQSRSATGLANARVTGASLRADARELQGPEPTSAPTGQCARAAPVRDPRQRDRRRAAPRRATRARRPPRPTGAPRAIRAARVRTRGGARRRPGRPQRGPRNQPRAAQPAQPPLLTERTLRATAPTTTPSRSNSGRRRCWRDRSAADLGIEGHGGFLCRYVGACPRIGEAAVLAHRPASLVRRARREVRLAADRLARCWDVDERLGARLGRSTVSACRVAAWARRWMAWSGGGGDVLGV
jgi:hypothetical protein